MSDFAIPLEIESTLSLMSVQYKHASNLNKWKIFESTAVHFDTLSSVKYLKKEVWERFAYQSL